MTTHNYLLIPDPHNTGHRIVGIRINKEHEAWGEYGLTEAMDWLRNQLECTGIRKHEGQKLLVKYVLDNDQGLSESSRTILKALIGEDLK